MNIRRANYERIHAFRIRFHRNHGSTRRCLLRSTGFTCKRKLPDHRHPVTPLFIKNLAKIKRAAAITNRKAGRLKPEIANAIESACNEVVCGMFDKEFIVDGIQGGAGTSANMNMNEVIANRAIEMLCGKKEITPLFIQTTTSIWHSPQTMSFQPPEN